VVVTQTSHRHALAAVIHFCLGCSGASHSRGFDSETVSAERGGAAAPSSQVSALEDPRRPCRHGFEIGAVRLHFEVRFRGFYQCARVASRSDILKPDVLVVAGRTHSQRVFGRVDRTSGAEQGTRPVPEGSSETIRKLSMGRRHSIQLGASCIVNLLALWHTKLVISWHSEF
jgi:hypothetical protein